MKSIREMEFKGKRVLMRVDFNVPIKEGKVSSTVRIERTLPSIKYIIERGGKLILLSHLGRPKGKVVSSLSLKPVAYELSKLLGKGVKFLPQCVGKEVGDYVQKMKEGEVVLLENTRFYPGEKENETNFCKALATLGDIYVTDAFGTLHRKHASTYGVVKYFEEKGVGFLVEKELKYLGKLVKNPDPPFLVVLGGAKISDKLEIVENLLPLVDNMLIGGGMVFTFFKMLGYEVGNSIVEEDRIGWAAEVYKRWGKKIILPEDIVIGDKFPPHTRKEEVEREKIKKGWIGLDIGSKTVAKYVKIIDKGRTIFWNGPMGVAEFKEFEFGTRAVAYKIAEKKDSIKVAGGGDTIAFIQKFGYEDKFTHISTGGGASLEFLGKKTLPGIEVMKTPL